MKFFYLKIPIIIALLVVTSCKKNSPNSTTEKAKNIIKEIKLKYAPDRRTARFNASVTKKGKQLIIKGITTNKDALTDFKKQIDSSNIDIVDSLVLLPTEDLKGKTGIINNSVSNIRSTKGDASEMATQALLGTPVKILQKKGGWYMVQTPDKYIGWIYQSEMAIKDS